MLLALDSGKRAFGNRFRHLCNEGRQTAESNSPEASWLTGRFPQLARSERPDRLRLDNGPEGLTYQTLIASLLHEYASGRLREA